MVPGLPGSYEESPASLPDLSARDRRWCQGNLQHAAILPARGLHWVSRLHLLMGIGSYVTAPLWLLFLISGILISLQARFVPPNYFPEGRSLFPVWPSVDPVRSMWVFAFTMGVLLTPKLLSFAALLCNGADRRGCGGAVRALLSLLIETLIAGLLAPVTMVVQSTDVISILGGRDGGWQAQRRDDGGIRLRDVVARYWRITAFGLLLGAIAWSISVPLALWMSPVVIGLALAIPLVAITGSRSLGLGMKRLGLLLIPEERSAPRELAHAGALYRGLGSVPPANAASLAGDDALRAAHVAMLPPARRPRIDPIDAALLVGLAKLDEAETLDAALRSLTRAEKSAVLGDAGGVARIAALGA
jgi:membrane glycosyltransferase